MRIKIEILKIHENLNLKTFNLNIHQTFNLKILGFSGEVHEVWIFANLLLSVVQIHGNSDALEREHALRGRPTHTVLLVIHRLREAHHQIHLQRVIPDTPATRHS